MRIAFRIVSSAVAASSSVVHFVSGVKIAWWSTCICTVRPRHFRPIFPVNASTGTRSRNALPTPVVMFVAPGPSVDMHAPGRPVSRARDVGHEPGRGLVRDQHELDARFPPIASMKRMFWPPG